MAKDELEFYHSKGKLLYGTVYSLLAVALGFFLLDIAYAGKVIFLICLALFITVLFSFFAVANILKMVRGYPYITIADKYIQLDSFTKSEVNIYFEDINNIKVSETSFQKIIEIVLYDEDHYFAKLSFHNKVRLFMNRITGFCLFTISAKVVQKQDRSALLEKLDLIMQQKSNNDVPINETLQKKKIETDFMEKYDLTPKVNRSINGSYFLKSYGYGFIIFAVSFILFYLLASKNDDYLFYIIISFIFFPFGRVLIDWLFGFKLRHSIDKQKGITYYFRQLEFMLDLILFYASLLFGPIGIIFLLIRYIVIRLKR